MIDFSVDISSLVLPDGHAISGSIDSEDDVRSALGRVSEGFGFRGFMVLAIPESGSHSLTAQALMTTWPYGFLRRYDSARLIDAVP